ncbi:MAG TPA: transglycosylase domain-containing protein [Novosphingobium sp.]|nr:transglycosylase domain-containing protein [Novosphingobium sp.]
MPMLFTRRPAPLATTAPLAPLPPTDGVLYGTPPPAPRRSRWWWFRRISAGLCALFVVLVAWLALTAPLSKSLQPLVPPQLTLLAADGTPIARTGAVVAEPVKVKGLPPHVVQAFLAIEDRDFYSHWGVSPKGIARAAWGNITSNRTQGGSTITQQLAKFTFLTPERSMTRKAREALIAFWLEAWLSKDEILERYLSNAYFGDNTYGLRAASLHYFHRKPERLTPGQAAMLAGLMQAPSRYAPTKNYRIASARTRTVIAAMVAAGYLSAKEAKAVAMPRLDVRGQGTLPTGTYFADWAVPEARGHSETGYAAQTQTTTLDARLQAAARRAINRASLGKAQVALVAMKPTGEVVAMIGGRDYAKSSFNRVTQARRQPGSTFKLFVYLAALRGGWEPDDKIGNAEIVSGSYRPKNAGGRYSKELTLAEAFASSSNVAAVRLYNEVGSAAVIQTARDLGVTAPLTEGDPSMALGTSGMTLLELTAAYAAVAGAHNPVRPSAFPAREEDWMDWLLGRRRALSEGNREAMRELLRGAVEHGTGRAARLGQPVYGKTGTSQDSRDALFVGFAGDLVVGVWVGNDDNSPLAGITGGGVPARIWADFMRQALGGRATPAPRPNPSGPVEPLDVPDATDIPLGDGASLSVENGEAVLGGEGLPVGVRIGEDGVRIEDRRTAEQVARDREALQRAQEQARDAIEQASERAAEAQRRIEQEVGR